MSAYEIRIPRVIRRKVGIILTLFVMMITIWRMKVTMMTDLAMVCNVALIAVGIWFTIQVCHLAYIWPGKKDH